MEHAKFLFRFNNNILPDYFKNYFVKLETIHHYHTRQKNKKDFFHTFARIQWRRKMIQRKGLKTLKKNTSKIKKLFVSKIQTNVRKECFPKLHKYFSKISLSFIALLQLFCLLHLLTGSILLFSNLFCGSNGLKCGCDVRFC